MPDQNRRRFLKYAGVATAATAVGLGIPKAIAEYYDMAQSSPEAFQRATGFREYYEDIVQLQTPEVQVSLTEREKIAHLMRRAGFGVTEAELDQFGKKGLDRTITELVNYPPNEPKLDEALAKMNLDLTKLGNLQTWWITRMIVTERPLLEKMTLFWHGLFATSIRRVEKPSYMLQQNQFFRENALGDFRDILIGISKDPAMLIWLDSNSNRRGAPNENYARELMELFSMGIGNYTETDVKEAARAFTGWHLSRQGQFVFNSNLHDYGAKTYLGEKGTFDGTDIIDIIVKNRANARFIAKRLFSFFAYENPEAEVIDKFAEIYSKNNRSIKAVVEAILRSDEFYSPKARFTTVRSPVDLTVSGRRLVGGTVNPGITLASMRRTGQELFAPPDVSGWHTGMAWISTARLLERFNYGAALAAVPLNGNDIVSQAKKRKLASPEGLVEFLDMNLLQRHPKEERRLALIELARASLGTNPSDATIEKATRSLIAVIAATPEFQLE